MSDGSFTTDRLRLREWRAEDDVPASAMRTPTYLRWLEDADMVPRNPGSIAERQRRLMADHGHCFWVVERLSDGAFLGYCGLKRVNAEGTALTGSFEIGWGLAEAHWGQGYATEAAQAALDRAFITHDAPYVVAFTVEGNRPSWRIMEKIGMTLCPDLTFDDPAFSPALNPTIVYRIDRAEWSASR